MTTLVIGARGGIGRHVLDQLLAAGEPVRASVRDDRAGADLPATAEVVTADLTRPEMLLPALDGVRRVFLYAPPSGAEHFAAAAAQAGVERVVLLSSGSILLPGMKHNAIAAEHRAVEDALTAADLPWTPVRPLVLASNTLRWAESIKSGDAVSLVYPDAVTAPVHERDVAAVAVAALPGRSRRWRITTHPNRAARAGSARPQLRTVDAPPHPRLPLTTCHLHLGPDTRKRAGPEPRYQWWSHALGKTLSHSGQTTALN